MLTWLSQNIGTIIVCAILITVFALLIWSLIRGKKKGSSSCCGGCAGCALAGQCHPNTSQPTTPQSISDTPEEMIPTETGT